MASVLSGRRLSYFAALRLESDTPFWSKTANPVHQMLALRRLQLCLLNAAETKGSGIVRANLFHLVLKQAAIVDGAQEPSSKRIKTPSSKIDDHSRRARGWNVDAVVKEVLNTREISFTGI